MRKARNPAPRQILIGLLTLAALAALVVGARLLFADRMSPWRVVVPTVTTVVLVVITGVYAWMTYRLVQQSDPRARVRVEIEERAVSEVTKVLTTRMYRIQMMREEYPLQIADGSPPNMRLLMERLDDILPIGDTIRAHLNDLPIDLVDDAATLSGILLDGEHRVLALGSASAIEAAVAEAERRTWTVEGAKSADYTVVSRGERRRDWDDLVSGTIWAVASNSAERLAGRIEGRRAGAPRAAFGPSHGRY